MFQLIKRFPAAKKPKKDMNACTDALFAVLKGHILAFACTELGIEGIDSEIKHPTIISASTYFTLEKQNLSFVNEGGGELYYCKWCSAG